MAAAGGNGTSADATSDTSVVVRPATTDDAARAAALHSEQIADGFLSRLGPRFLTRLYRRVCRTDNSFLLVAEHSGRIVGFVAGSVDTRRLFAGFLARDGAAAVLGSAWPLLSSWRQVIETLRRGRGESGHAADGELLAIAVDPALQGRGVGRRLVDALLAEMDRRGAGTVAVVVGADNTPALSLYGSSGFAPVQRFELHRGTASVELHHAGRTPA